MLSSSLFPHSEEDAEMFRPVVFLNRHTWILLASLATDPATSNRHALAQRLWEDPERPYDESVYLRKLRPILTDLIHGKRNTGENKNKKYSGIGEESLIVAPGTIQLKPGIIVTDIEEAETLYRQAIQLEEPQERIESLRQAAQLLCGALLSGYDPTSAARDWYNGETAHIEELRHNVWTRILEAAKMSGDTLLRTQAWRHLQHLNGSETFGIAAKGRGASLLKWESILPYLEQQNQNRSPLTITEEKALLDLLHTRLERLPRQTTFAFRALSVFPASFTHRQAAAVTNLPEPAALEALTHLVKASLLRETADEPGVETRYSLLPFVAPLVWQKLSGSQKERLRTQHARYFARFDGDGQAWTDFWMDRQSDNVLRWIEADQASYRQAFQVCLKSPLNEERVIFITELVWCLSLVVSDENKRARKDVLRQATPRLRELAESKACFVWNAAYLLLVATMEEANFSEAILWVTVLRENTEDLRTKPHQWPQIQAQKVAASSSLAAVIEVLLTATHHAGLHNDFDKAVPVAYGVLGELSNNDLFREETVLRFQRGIHFLEAENCWARGDYEIAFASNKAALEDLIKLVVFLPEVRTWFAATYYQRGCIEWARGNSREALADWNEAMEQFQQQNAQHGIADCKKRIGRALAEMGQYGIAQYLIGDAIATYAAMEKEPSRIAAVGVLGDVLAMRGNVDDARRCYEEGLRFWQSTNHPSWVERFEASLNELELSKQRQEAPTR